MIEFIIRRKLIDWNINFSSVYLELLNVLSWKKQLKKYQTFSKESDIPGTYKFYYNCDNSSETAFFKFYSKDWVFLKISTKLQIESFQFHDLMLLRKFDACFDPSLSYPDVFWYRLNGMGAQKCAQKSSCNTFSIYFSRKN